MLTRRTVVVAGTLAAGSTLAGSPLWKARAQAVLTDDGLYRQPWFVDSLLDLADDIETAHKAGKRLAVMWELKGCPYCKDTHFINFARPDIADYVKTNFDIVQLNILGARNVTDFDGTEAGEKAFAARYGVRFTPTIQFFPETAEGLKDKPAAKREVARATGYLRPDEFLAMFRFVRDKAYETQNFRDYLKRGS